MHPKFHKSHNLCLAPWRLLLIGDQKDLDPCSHSSPPAIHQRRKGYTARLGSSRMVGQQSRLEEMEGERRLCSGHLLVHSVTVVGPGLRVEPYVAREPKGISGSSRKDGSESSRDL